MFILCPFFHAPADILCCKVPVFLSCGNVTFCETSTRNLPFNKRQPSSTGYVFRLRLASENEARIIRPFTSTRNFTTYLCSLTPNELAIVVDRYCADGNSIATPV